LCTFQLSPQVAELGFNFINHSFGGLDVFVFQEPSLNPNQTWSNVPMELHKTRGGLHERFHHQCMLLMKDIFKRV